MSSQHKAPSAIAVPACTFCHCEIWSRRTLHPETVVASRAALSLAFTPDRSVNRDRNHGSRARIGSTSRRDQPLRSRCARSGAARSGPEDVAPGDRCGQRCSVVARVHARSEREPRPEPRVESRYRVASSPGSGIAVPVCTLCHSDGRSWAASARAPAPTPSGGRTAVSRQPSPEAERACRAQRRACRALADGGCRCRSGTRSRTD